MAISVDSDQMLHSAASDLGLHYLQRPICPITSGYYGMILCKNYKIYCHIYHLIWSYTITLLKMYHNNPRYWGRLVWANSVDTDQTLQNKESDQGLHCLPLFSNN